MGSWKRIAVVIFVLIGSVTFFSYWSISQFNQAFDNLGLTSTSLETSGEVATSTPELSLTFPKKGTGVYIGCTYPISWQSSTTTSSLEIALVDASSSVSLGPITSGLAREMAIEKDSQNINWKVGFVRPGAYYIKISKINGVDTDTISKVFIINKIPESISASEQKNICEEFGGYFN